MAHMALGKTSAPASPESLLPPYTTQQANGSWTILPLPTRCSKLWARYKRSARKTWKKFGHIDAKTVDEAASILRTGKATVFSGRSDMLDTIRLEILPTYPAVVVNLKSIPGNGLYQGRRWRAENRRSDQIGGYCQNGATNYRVRRCNSERGSYSTGFLEASNALSKRFNCNAFAAVLHTASRKPIITTESRTRVWICNFRYLAVSS